MNSSRIPVMSRAEREVRRNRILGLLREGNPPSVIARFEGLSTDHVRQIGLNNGMRRIDAEVPEPHVSPLWEMNENARRLEIARRAARGARETRESVNW